MISMRDLFTRKGLYRIARVGAIILLLDLVFPDLIKAQDSLTGAFEGRVTNAETGAPIVGASVQFINQITGVPIAKRTDTDGRFYQALLQPGTYTIRVSAPDFRTAEVERRLLITQNNRVIPYPITLEPIKNFVCESRINLPPGTTAAAATPDTRPSLELATVNFNTNVTRGEIRFVNITTGEAPRIVPIQNGRGVLNYLQPGKYNVDIRSGEVGYKTLCGVFTLPGATDFNIELTKLSSNQTFVGKWGSFNLWEAPRNWKATASMLLVNEPGIAVPRDEAYRYYSNFDLTCDINMINGVAASFVVHAVDASNYYLIQLTGPNADERYVLRGFIVKNGVSKLFQTIQVDPFATTFQPGKFFELSMRMKDNHIEVSVTDSETGVQLPLGTITDPNYNFRVGAVGIAARDGERNEIGRFIVSPY